MTSHVKIHAVTPRIQYVADGALTEYEFSFAIFKTSDIDIYFGDSLQDTSTYTVSGSRHSDGGFVTFESAPAAGTIITIVRNLSIERTSDFQDGGTLRADTLNYEFDYQIACQQQIADNLNRSMVLPPYAPDNDLDLTLPFPSAGKAIVWNSDGTNLENSTVSVNALESTLNGYKTATETAATIATAKASEATVQAETATSKATIAGEQATIATQKAAEAQQTLSSKANKNMDDLTDVGKNNIVTLGMPDYSAGTSISSSDIVAGFTAPKNGIFLGTFHTSATNGWIYVNNVPLQQYGGSNNHHESVTLLLNKDDVIKMETASLGSASLFNFFPFKGSV